MQFHILYFLQLRMHIFLDTLYVLLYDCLFVVHGVPCFFLFLVLLLPSVNYRKCTSNFISKELDSSMELVFTTYYRHCSAFFFFFWAVFIIGVVVCCNLKLETQI
jgi:hypothetical protein